MNLDINHAPGAGSITPPIDLHATSVLRLPNNARNKKHTRRSKNKMNVGDDEQISKKKEGRTTKRRNLRRRKQ